MKTVVSGEGALSEFSVTVRIAASGEVCIEVYDKYMYQFQKISVVEPFQVYV